MQQMHSTKSNYWLSRIEINFGYSSQRQWCRRRRCRRRRRPHHHHHHVCNHQSYHKDYSLQFSAFRTFWPLACQSPFWLHCQMIMFEGGDEAEHTKRAAHRNSFVGVHACVCVRAQREPHRMAGPSFAVRLTESGCPMHRHTPQNQNQCDLGMCRANCSNYYSSCRWSSLQPSTSGARGRAENDTTLQLPRSIHINWTGKAHCFNDVMSNIMNMNFALLRTQWIAIPNAEAFERKPFIEFSFE